MMIRLHKNYKDFDQQRNIRFGMACLKKVGISVETLIELFPAQLGRIKLEMDMGNIPSKHVARNDEHPYILAAEYLIEELLSPPFLPEKYGIPIVLPAEYVAFLAMGEESDYLHGYHTLDDRSAIQLLMESDEYMMAALLMGFEGVAKTIHYACHDDLVLLANKRPYSLQHISPQIVPDTIWMQALKNDASVYTLLPERLMTMENLSMACRYSPYAFMCISSVQNDFLPSLMRKCRDNYNKIVDLIPTQREIETSIYLALNDEDFVREMSCNSRIMNNVIFEGRSVDVSIKVIKCHFENDIMNERVDSFLSAEVIEKCLDMGYLRPEQVYYERSTEINPRHAQAVHDNGHRNYYDDIAF